MHWDSYHLGKTLPFKTQHDKDKSEKPMEKSEESKNMMWFVLAWLLFPHHMVLHNYAAANNQNITHSTLLAGLLHVEGKIDSA